MRSLTRATTALPLLRALPVAMLSLALAACGNDTLPNATLDNGDSTHDVAAVHDAVLVLDGHADVLLPDTPQRYYLPDGERRNTLARLQQGSVDAIVFSIAVGPGDATPEADAKAKADADAKLATVQAWIADAGDRAALALTADDITRLQSEGKVAVLLGFQNARILGEDLSAFDRFHEAGVRVAGLAHAGHNAFADSSRPQAGEPDALHGGLSPLGKQAVRRFNDLGVLIDVSQLTPEGVKQTIELSRAPVVASHSNARALIDNARNLGDDELDAIQANGGVVLVTPFNSYLKALDAGERERASTIRARHGLAPTFQTATEGYQTLPIETQDAFLGELKAEIPPATVGDLVDHIDYIAKRIGIAHVGIGSDFDHGAGIDGFDSPADAANVTAELLRRGYTREQVAAIWSDNFLRALREAQTASLQNQRDPT